MANAYIMLANSTGTLVKRFRVLADGYLAMLEKTQTRRRTVTGVIDNQEGPVCQRWQFIFKVYETDPTDPSKADNDVTGYGRLDHLETFFKLNNPGGSPSNVITFTDHYGNSHSVYLTGVLPEKPISVSISGTAAEFHSQIILEETTAVS